MSKETHFYMPPNLIQNTLQFYSFYLLYGLIWIHFSIPIVDYNIQSVYWSCCCHMRLGLTVSVPEAAHLIERIWLLTWFVCAVGRWFITWLTVVGMRQFWTSLNVLPTCSSMICFVEAIPVHLLENLSFREIASVRFSKFIPGLVLKLKVLAVFLPFAIDEPFKRLTLYGLLLELVSFTTSKFVISATSLSLIRKYLSWIIGSLASPLFSLRRSQFTVWNRALYKRYSLILKTNIMLKLRLVAISLSA